MDPQQLYLELYKEYRIEIRHQETQRSAVSTICVGLAAGLVGLIFQEKFSAERQSLCLVLLNFSFVAILMLRKLYERFALARERAQLYLSHIDMCPQTVSGDNASRRTAKSPSLIDLWAKGREINLS